MSTGVNKRGAHRAGAAFGGSDRAHRAARITAAAAFLGVAGVVWLNLIAYRSGEAWIAGQVSHLVTGSNTWVSRPNSTFFLDVGTSKVFGIKVTSECTSAMITIGFLVVTAALMGVSRFRFTRLAVATIAAAGAFAALNVARLVMIALATRDWHSTGFHWTHVWAGTFLTVLGGVAVCVLYIAVITGRHRPTRSKES